MKKIFIVEYEWEPIGIVLAHSAEEAISRAKQQWEIENFETKGTWNAYTMNDFCEIWGSGSLWWLQYPCFN